MKSMDIVYLVPGLGISGGINVVMEHANLLQNRGHDVTIITMDGRMSVDWRENRCPVLSFTSSDTSTILASRTRDFIILTGWQTAYAAYLSNIPTRAYAYFVQSDEGRFYDRSSIERLLATASYQLNCHYLTEAKWIQSWLKNYGHEALYAPNGIDHQLFYPRTPIVPRSFAAVQDLDVEVWAVSSADKLVL